MPKARRRPPSFDALATPPRVSLANYYPFGAGQIVGPQWSASNLFLPATHGRGHVNVGPERFALRAGQILHVPWAAPIRYEADAHEPFVVIGVHLEYRAWDTAVTLRHLSSQKADPRRTAMEPPPNPQPYSEPFVLEPPPDAPLFDLATAIANAYETTEEPGYPPATREALLRGLALAFLLEFLRAEAQGMPKPGGPRVHPQAGLVAEMVSWMRLSYARPLKRAELARRAGVSESSLAAAFRSVTGRAPMDYLIELRLAHARRLLRTGRLRVGEIAEKVGVPDVYYFSKLFKRRVGFGPLEYRKRLSL